jgi:hypothetical protein
VGDDTISYTTELLPAKVKDTIPSIEDIFVNMLREEGKIIIDSSGIIRFKCVVVSKQ